MISCKNLLGVTLILLSACSVRYPSTELSANEQCEILYKNRMKSERQKRTKKSTKSITKVQASRATRIQPITIAIESKQALNESNITSTFTSVAPTIENARLDSVRISIPIPTRERHLESELVNTLSQPSVTLNTTRSTSTKKWKWSKAPLLIAFSGLMTLLGLALFRTKARALSLWAARHPKTSQGIITASQMVVGGTAFVAGGILFDHGFLISDAVTQTALACAAGAMVLYPFNHTPKVYIRRKAHDIALVGAGTILALSVGNNQIIQNRIPILTQPIAHVQSFVNDKVESVLSATVVNQDPEKKPRENIGLKALLTLLTLLAFGALGILVAALSCELSCSGAGALAAVVLIGGAYLVIAGAAAVIRKIWGLKRRRSRMASTIPTT